MHAWIHHLADAAVSVAGSATNTRIPESLAVQLKDAGQHLRMRQEGAATSSGGEAAPPDIFTLRQLLQPAADLAALMRQYYALPAVAAERQLALAQAAAGRSCAYLRCANLGGEGGPAAGQGVGSMRCRCGRTDVAVGWAGEQGKECCCCSAPGCMPAELAKTVCTSFSSLPFAVPAARCGTAAPPARTPTGGRAGTAVCARHWARRGGRPRRRQRRRQQIRDSYAAVDHACLHTVQLARWHHYIVNHCEVCCFIRQ